MSIREKVRSYAIDITVFSGGGLVMIYEIIGSRILSPYVGTSTYTWTSLIGVILAALSVGYWTAGKLADRNPSVSVLSVALLAASALVSFTVLLKDLILSALSRNSLPLEAKTLVSALVLFAPAAAMMGFIVPYAVKLKTKTLEETGSTVGRLYALSTAGSIIGTFLAGFVLIPFVGSSRTLYAIAGILFGLSVLLAPFTRSREKAAALTLLAAGIGVNEAAAYVLGRTYNLHDSDTRYSRVMIFDTTRAGRELRAMSVDPYVFQSSMYLDDGSPASAYDRYYHLIRHFTPGFERVLMIGGAGYSFPKEFIKRYPEKKIDVVEIDPGMTALARRHFRLKNDPDLSIIHEDGRVFLNRGPSGEYDAVLLDAFSTLFSVPHQLTTIEAVREISRLLRPGGVVMINLGTAAQGSASLFLRAEFATYRAVFADVRLFRVDPSKDPERVQNVMLVALKEGGSGKRGGEDEELELMLANRMVEGTVQPLPVLTDDLAPVEYYASFAQSQFVSESR